MLQQYKSPGGGHVPLGAASFQTAWRGTRAARRQAPPKELQSLQQPPGGNVHTVRRTQPHIAFVRSLSPGGTSLTARRTTP
ncbi:hypothetical protein DEO72_LG5g1375 [Vigna unguiculata]|uniref:Uncharacterized protein n=1 Tax=Vigna unguiculata TaxID=3917 RepID=A0A4D6LWP4_VIGUN|nr:hypothetical protein DEO72_LG5g1375 [Vigna unguiculata]